MKQIDYLRKIEKNCSALLMACALTFMLLTTTLSFAQTNSLTLGCPTRNGNSYQYAALSLTAGDGVVRSISISFSENPDGCSISLPSTSWTVSGNDFSKYIILPENTTRVEVENFLKNCTFIVPNGNLVGVNVILSIDDASRQIFYFAGNGHYYEYVPYTGTKSWTDAYNEAKGLEYCGRPGYLATLTTAEEDGFVTRIVQNAMWIGGTRLSPASDLVGTQYYEAFDTGDQSDPESIDYWYWACGPEKGAKITNEITNVSPNTNWYSSQPREPNGYSNWMYNASWGGDYEPNNRSGESALTILRLNRGILTNYRSENGSAEIGGYVFGWNDVTYLGNNSADDWRPKGYLVEYGDQSIGHSQTDEACSISASGLVGNATRTVKATLSGSTAVCAGEEATLNIIFEGGAFPFTGSVQENNGEVVHTFNTNDISYNFTVTPTETTSYTISTFSDASSTGEAGCEVYTINYTPSGSATVTVNNPQVALNDIASVAICAGASTTLTATTTETVTGEVSYAWSTGATESEITVAPTSTTTYTVTATATQGGCTATATKEVTVTVNNPQVALNDIQSVAICAGASTTLTATTETATGEVSYAWSTGATGSEITVTPTSTTTYTVTATATQGGCTATATKSVTVTVNKLTATVSVNDALCNGASNGSVELSVSGGTTPYSYVWSNEATTEDLSSVSVGTYTVTVTDANGCTTTTTATIDEPAQLTLTIVSATDETCAGNDGSVALTVSGGTTPYRYAWSNGDTTKNLSSVPAGTYTVTVSDAKGCTTTATDTITLNNNFTVSASNTAICSGATFTVNPTTYHTAKYSWAAPTATGIDGAEAGTDVSNISGTLTNITTSETSITYTVTATTANGLCTADPFDVVVTVYAPVTGGSIQKDFIVCNGLDSVVTLTNSVSGNGGVNGAYIWQSVSNDTTTTIEGANGETYTPEPIVGTVQYQRVYTTGCGNKPSNAVSVTYYGNVSPGTVVCSNGCAANYCYGSDINVTLSTSGISVGSGTTPTIQWQQSVNGGDWTDIPDANDTTYTYNKNNFTEPIKFRYTIQLPSCDSVPSNNVHSIGVWALPVVSIAEVTTLCPSVASTDIKGTIEPPTTPNYTYHWSPGSGLELSNLPQSATSETSNTITGTFPTDNCNATYSASLYVVDGHGCKSNTATETFTVVDTEVPVISGTLDTINVEGCTVSAAPAAYTTVSELIEAGLNIEDNCGLQDAVTSKQTSTGSCPIVITRTYTVKDLCGDSATVSQTININQADFTMPENAGSTVECATAATAPTTLPEVKDACGNVLEPIGDPVVSTKPVCEGKRTYTYTYRDCAGHSHDWTYTYTIDMPTFAAIASQAETVDCPEDAVAPHTRTDYTMPVVTDACENNVDYVLTTTLDSVSCEGTKAYVYTYTDCAGNSQTFTYTYTIDMPTFAAIAPQTETVDCPEDAVAPHTRTDFTMPVVTDVCGNNVDYELTTTPNAVSCEGPMAYVYTYTDCANNSQTFTYTYTIDRTTAPNEVGGPVATASTVGCIADATAPTTLPVVKDVCGNTLTDPTLVEGGTYTDCEGTKTYTYTYEDCSGLQYVWTYTYTITAPTLTFTGSINDVENVDACYSDTHKSRLLTAEEVKAMYTSSCSREITVEISDNVESDNDCNWKITRTYNISDGGCNTDSTTMSVSGSDQTAPAIGTDDLDRTLTSTNCVFTIPDMREIVRNISTDCSEITVTQPSAGMVVYPMVAERDTTVNVIVTDSCGNSSVKEVVITIPAKVTISATATPAVICYGATSQLTATPSNVVGTATYNWTPSDGLNNATIANPVATLTTTTTYTVEVTDENGCAATATTTVNVNPEVVMDAVDPMTLCVGDVTSYNFTTPLTVGTMSYAWTNSNTAIGLAANGDGDILSFTPTNTTNAPINATISVTPSHTYNDIICVGDPINFTITVRPSITTPGNVEFACPADTTVVLSYSDCEQVVNIGEPEFENHMSGMNVNITNDAPAGNIFPEGTTIVTWTATDECGDTLTCTQNVQILFPPCGDSIADFDGYRYSSVRIGCQCWTGENARSEHYSDGTPVDNFRYYNDSDSLENIYGKLYTWYTAVRVPEGDNNAEPSTSTDPFGTTYVQGICPEGWALPTVDEYMLMIANSGDATHAKDGSNLYWLPGYEGQPPFSGFDAYGAGKYNGAIDRYQELLGKTYFWTTLSGSGSETATTVEINYYCAEGLQTKLSKGDGVSIRCIRKR